MMLGLSGLGALKTFWPGVTQIFKGEPPSREEQMCALLDKAYEAVIAKIDSAQSEPTPHSQYEITAQCFYLSLCLNALAFCAEHNGMRRLQEKTDLFGEELAAQIRGYNYGDEWSFYSNRDLSHVVKICNPLLHAARQELVGFFDVCLLTKSPDPQLPVAEMQ